MGALRSVSIDRTSLSKATLAIGPGHAGTFTVAGEGLFRPDVTWRLTYADDHPDLDGSVLLHKARQQASLPFAVLIRTATRALLGVAQDELEEAVGQFSYVTTINVDGEQAVWSCDPGAVEWGRVKADDLALQQVATITIPVYPIPGSVT